MDLSGTVNDYEASTHVFLEAARGARRPTRPPSGSTSTCAIRASTPTSCSKRWAP